MDRATFIKKLKMILVFSFMFGILAWAVKSYFFVPGVCVRASELKEAMYYQRLSGKTVQCLLCPRLCKLRDSQRGFCKSRINISGKLYSMTYGKSIAMNYPATMRPALIHCSIDEDMLRVSTSGCNMRCKFCYSWWISQSPPEEVELLSNTRKVDAVTSATPLPVKFSPKDIVSLAKKSKCRIIAYNVANEPTVNYEHVLETARLAKKSGLINALVTNGYINEEPLKELLRYMDGVSVGLKGFSEEVYSRYCSARLEPVLETLKTIKAANVGFEISYPLILGVNDDREQIEKMCLWISRNLGSYTPLQFIRFHPAYKMLAVPPTPITVLEEAEKIARAVGLKNISINYLGDYPGGDFEEKIFCPECGKLILHRKGEAGIVVNNTKDGKCNFCGHQLLFIIIDKNRDTLN